MSSMQTSPVVKTPPGAVSQPRKTAGSSFSQTVTYPLHSKDTLKRYEDGQLSPVYSGLVMLTKTPLKIIGSVLTAILAPILGIKLFSSSESDSFFGSWSFLALLGLGAVSSFGANSYLSPSPVSADNSKSKDSIPMIGSVEKPNSVINSLSPPEQAVITGFFDNGLLSFEPEEISYGSFTSLTLMGIELVKDTASNIEFIQTLHKKGDFTSSNSYQTLEEVNKVIGLKVQLKDIESALRNPNYKFEVQFIVKDSNAECFELPPYKSITTSLSELKLTGKGETPVKKQRAAA